MTLNQGNAGSAGNPTKADIATVYLWCEVWQCHSFRQIGCCCLLLVHDGFGVWCAARRLDVGRFLWPRGVPEGSAPMTLKQPRFDALVLGLLWQRLLVSLAVSDSVTLVELWSGRREPAP